MACGIQNKMNSEPKMNLPAAKTAGIFFKTIFRFWVVIPAEAGIQAKKNTGFPGRHERQLGQAASSAE
jgi:hypothetical protein